MRRLIRKNQSAADSFSATVDIRPSYQDCDPAGVVWHGNYFHYFDTARVALLAKLDYGYRQMEASGYVFPVVDTRVRYLVPATYDQLIRVSATLREWEYRLKIEYEVRDAADKFVAEAYTIQVAVEIATGELCIGSPEPLLSRIVRAGLPIDGI